MTDRNTLSTMQMAILLDVTPRWLTALASRGVLKPAGRGQWPLFQTVQDYIRFQMAETERLRGSAAHERLRNAKAQEVEARIARRDAELMDLAEAVKLTDELAAAFLDSIEGMPARITTHPTERRRLEAIFKPERDRLAAAFARERQRLLTGRDEDPFEGD